MMTMVLVERPLPEVGVGGADDVVVVSVSELLVGLGVELFEGGDVEAV